MAWPLVEELFCGAYSYIRHILWSFRGHLLLQICWGRNRVPKFLCLFINISLFSFRFSHRTMSFQCRQRKATWNRNFIINTIPKWAKQLFTHIDSTFKFKHICFSGVWYDFIKFNTLLIVCVHHICKSFSQASDPGKSDPNPDLTF